MEEEARELEALFRYALIREAAAEELGPRQRGRLLRELTSQSHLHPDGHRRQVSRTTLGRWLRSWRQGGFEALKPQKRESPPRTDQEILEAALALRREKPYRTGAHIAEILSREHGDKAPAERTIQRHLARAGLIYGAPAHAKQSFGRFEADHPNELWVADCLHGPAAELTVQGKKRKAILFAILDDHSRLCVGARFEAAETELRLERTLRGAIESRGVPGALYVDNGAPFASRRLERACAKLGIRLIHSRPGQPEGRGKIERFFRTLRDQFLIEAKDRSDLDFETLNRLLSAWLSEAYHQSIHSETGQSPIDRFQALRPTYATAPEVREAFIWAETRVVTKTATFTLLGNRYEVDRALTGRKVEILFDPYDLSKIEVRYAGKSFGDAVPHEIKRHTHPKAQADQAIEQAEPLAEAIDYLALIQAEHERSLSKRSAIDYRRLSGGHDGPETPDTDHKETP